MSDLEAARRKFGSDWRDLQQSVQKETGLTTRWQRSWVWPALALAAGVAAGAGFWWRRGRKG
jgi:hypothetical protein